MPDVIEVFGGAQIEVITTPERVVEIIVPGPAGAQGPQGIPGVTPVTTANFDGGNAFTVPSNPHPAFDLGSAM